MHGVYNTTGGRSIIVCIIFGVTEQLWLDNTLRLNIIRTHGCVDLVGASIRYMVAVENMQTAQFSASALLLINGQYCEIWAVTGVKIILKSG